MIRKILESFFRHKLLLLLPPLLVPAVVTPLVIASTPPVYETTVSIWIESPQYAQLKDPANPWATPVQLQASRLGELLKTRAFQDDVAQRTTSLAPLVGNPAGEARLGDVIVRSISVVGMSDHLLVLKAQSSTAQLSYELCTAVVEAFQEKSGADQVDQAGVAISFYQGRLKDAQTQLTKASQDLKRYAASRQIDLGTTDEDPTSLLAKLPASVLDSRLNDLQTAVQTAQGQVNTYQTRVTSAQQDLVAGMSGQQFNFQVLDPPQQPLAPTSQTKKIIIYPLVGAVAGLGLSGIVLVLLVASDRSVRSESDLPAGMRIIGGIPTLKRKRIPKSLRGVATRRGVGAVAGMQLPAPRGAKG